MSMKAKSNSILLQQTAELRLEHNRFHQPIIHVVDVADSDPRAAPAHHQLHVLVAREAEVEPA